MVRTAYNPVIVVHRFVIIVTSSDNTCEYVHCKITECMLCQSLDSQ